MSISNAVIPLACRPDLLLCPLQGEEPGAVRYAVKDLRGGECFVLAAQEQFLLARLDGARTTAGLRRAYQERFGESLTEAELLDFVELARTRGFLQPSEPGTARAEEEPHQDGAAVACRYDEIPYSSRPFPQTHPDNLATVATLFGMKPPPVERCRVLELGCAAGGNLIPMATTLPNSQFVGIDLSGRQIADGRRMLKALGLRNVELLHLSIMDFDSLEPFDYVLCHGVYSWVPPDVQDRILEICRRHLTANGVAYVSYNTYPGWHLPGVLRAALRYHTERFDDPTVRVRQARALLSFLAALPPENDGYGGALHRELQTLRGVPDHYLYHEYLAEVNAPVYFHEFNARAEGRGLQYLGEAVVLEMLTEHFSPEIGQTLRLLSQGHVEKEQQFVDFVRNRRFRQSLLCHRGVPLERSLSGDRLGDSHVASAFRAVSARPDLAAGVSEEFITPRGLTLTAADPAVKAALLHLAEVWPAAVPFGELAGVAQARLECAPVDAQRLLSLLLKCSGPGAVEFSVNAPRLAAKVGRRPKATPLARLEARSGRGVTNLRHEVVTPGPLDCWILRLLDGSRDRARLLAAMTDAAERGTLPGLEEGVRMDDAVLLEQCLCRLARHALLVG